MSVFQILRYSRENTSEYLQKEMNRYEYVKLLKLLWANSAGEPAGADQLSLSESLQVAEWLQRPLLGRRPGRGVTVIQVTVAAEEGGDPPSPPPCHCDWHH